jgi:hypothetical protein
MRHNFISATGWADFIYGLNSEVAIALSLRPAQAKFVSAVAPDHRRRIRFISLRYIRTASMISPIMRHASAILVKRKKMNPQSSET